MSRSGYSEDCDDNWSLIMWRGAVNSALKGKRGQAFLVEMAAAMDAMPDKKLITNELADKDGCFCTLGVIGASRGIDMSVLDPEDYERVASTFGVATAMAQEIVWMNDEIGTRQTPEERWQRMRSWVEKQIAREASNA